MKFLEAPLPLCSHLHLYNMKLYHIFQVLNSHPPIKSYKKNPHNLKRVLVRSFPNGKGFDICHGDLWRSRMALGNLTPS